MKKFLLKILFKRSSMTKKSEPIVMLTHNDITVKNALDLFSELYTCPVSYWGIKEKGLCEADMIKLCNGISAKGKKAVLEAVTYTEEDSMTSAYTAVKCGCDILMGTLYSQKVHKILKENNIKYMPFVGRVYGRPSVLEGSLEEIISEVRDLKEKGVFGIDLLGYRYNGDAEALISDTAKTAELPVCVAGSIDSYEKLDFIKEISPAFFTVGSALFENKFGSTLEEQIENIKARIG